MSITSMVVNGEDCRIVQFDTRNGDIEVYLIEERILYTLGFETLPDSIKFNLYDEPHHISEGFNNIINSGLSGVYKLNTIDLGWD